MVQVRGHDGHYFPVTRSTLTTLVFSRGAFNYPTRSSLSFSMNYGGAHHECVQKHASVQAAPPGEERGPPGPGPQGERPPTAASAANTSLPSAMLGDWCYSKTQQGYVRQKCGDDNFLVVRRDGFVTLDVKCKFDKIEQRVNGAYLVHSTCTDGEEDDDRGPPYTENQEYRIIGKKLTIHPAPG